MLLALSGQVAEPGRDNRRRVGRGCGPATEGPGPPSDCARRLPTCGMRSGARRHAVLRGRVRVWKRTRVRIRDAAREPSVSPLAGGGRARGLGVPPAGCLLPGEKTFALVLLALGGQVGKPGRGDRRRWQLDGLRLGVGRADPPSYVRGPWADMWHGRQGASQAVLRGRVRVWARSQEGGSGTLRARLLSRPLRVRDAQETRVCLRRGDLLAGEGPGEAERHVRQSG